MATLPILYSFRRCPYAMRARLALAYAGIGCELREVRLRDKPAALLQASPKGTVPVLVLPDGTVIEQSLDIMRWALAQHDPDGWLHTGPLTEQLALIDGNDRQFKPALDRCKYPERYPVEDVNVARTQAHQWLLHLNARLQDQPNLCGAKTSLADMALLPFVRQFAKIDQAVWMAQPWSALQAWLERHLQTSLFAQVMAVYPVWQADKPGPCFGQSV